MPTSDQTVTSKLVLQAQLELQRLGTTKAMSLLESTEPDLTEFALETTTNLYHDILSTGASGKQARRIHENILTLVLVSVTALRKAHAALWQDDADESPAPQPHRAPPADGPQ